MNTIYFQTGGFTIQVNSDIPIKPDTFHPKLKHFEANGPGEENISINLFFNKAMDIAVSEKERIYFQRPWAIYKKKDKIIYEWITEGISDAPGRTFFRKISANKDHTQIDIYNDVYLANVFKKGRIENITLLSTDQIFMSRVLGFHHGCLIHSTGIIHNGNGLLFIGQSGAGKTTIARMMQNTSTILCDDRNIIRKKNNGYRLYGTWRHSDLETVSSQSAPLKAIFILNQSPKNQIVPLTDVKQRFFFLMDLLVTSLVTQDWMNATMDLLENISKDIAFYHLYFDKTGDIKNLIDKL